jgi:hypothetical protein
MLSIPGKLKIILSVAPADMRKQWRELTQNTPAAVLNTG